MYDISRMHEVDGVESLVENELNHLI